MGHAGLRAGSMPSILRPPPTIRAAGNRARHQSGTTAAPHWVLIAASAVTSDTRPAPARQTPAEEGSTVTVTNYAYAAGPWNVRSEAGFRHSHIVMETAVRHSRVVVESETDSHRCDAGWRLAARLSCGFITSQLVVRKSSRSGEPGTSSSTTAARYLSSCITAIMHELWRRLDALPNR
jgi:hypothetical protein